MSVGVLSSAAASSTGLGAAIPSVGSSDDVIEIGLLLPVEWATALMELSEQRRESVGQLLRGIIGRELTGNRAGL
jgi:hypothetical protein